ncbi:MAG: hypothetical protein JWM56_1302 [Candidatus Peribacteria bacterium]|nr:hypothetical protein [Candidatus Peribacteria bacterium]
MKDDTDITPKILLQHMQAMQAALIDRMNVMHGSLQKDIVAVQGEVHILRTEHQRLERKIDTLTLGVDSIDARLDTIEIEKLPQRVKALEMHR